MDDSKNNYLLSVPILADESELDTHLRELEANCEFCKSSKISDPGVEFIRAESELRMIAVYRIANILGIEEARKKVSECESYIDEMNKESARRTFIGDLLDQLERHLNELDNKLDEFKEFRIDKIVGS